MQWSYPGDCLVTGRGVIEQDGCQYRGAPEKHQECGPQLHGRPGQGAGGHQQRPLGPVLHPDVRDRGPHLQHGRFLRDHADDLEEAERPRQELAARVQGAGAAGVPHQDWQREGDSEIRNTVDFYLFVCAGCPAMQGEHICSTDPEGFPVC